jgi:hypothetical protein
MAGRRNISNWEDLPGRRLRQDLETSEVALQRAKALARAERERVR